jgi:hypothetical protein
MSRLQIFPANGTGRLFSGPCFETVGMKMMLAENGRDLGI